LGDNILHDASRYSSPFQSHQQCSCIIFVVLSLLSHSHHHCASSAWLPLKRRCCHCYSPSLNPFFARRGSVFKYLILPVPVVLLLLAFWPHSTVVQEVTDKEKHNDVRMTSSHSNPFTSLPQMIIFIGNHPMAPYSHPAHQAATMLL
jgi:hypothetical protein